MNHIKGDLSTDDRGTVRFVNAFNFQDVKRFYQVENHRAGFIRAWHGHRKEAKYVYVARGSALVAAVPLGSLQDSRDVFKTVLSSNKPSVLYIPPGYANGFKTLEEDTIIQFFSTSSLQESLGDDIRFEYNTIPNIWDEDFR